MSPQRKGSPAATVAGRDFERALDQVLRAASADDSAGVLCCVRLDATSEGLRLVATDKARLAVADLPRVGSGTNFSVLVPATLLRAVQGSATDGTVSVAVEGDELVVEIEDQVHRMALGSGTFPNFEPFLAEDADARVLITERAALLAAIEDQPDDEPMRVRFATGQLELGQIVPIALAADYTGDDVVFWVNAAYLHDAVESASGGRLAIEASGRLSPVVIRTTDDESLTVVIMPLKVS